MKRFHLALAVALACPSAPCTAQVADAVFAVTGVRVFDGVSVSPSTTVVVTGGHIVAIGDDAVVPESALRIDGAGRTLLPGLIDAHVHTLGEPESLRDAVHFGVTTVLEMLTAPGRMRALRAAAADETNGAVADYFSSGAGATVPGGHGHFSEEYPTLTDSTAVDGFVAERIAEGSQYIKIFIERGFSRRGSDTRHP